jgi:hypothetical protein
MFRIAKYIAALGLVVMLGQASATDRRIAAQLHASLPDLVVSEDYRGLSQATMQLAGAQSRLGETPAACKALSQSLESYRMALVKETGVQDDSVSGLGDDSSGMADVRARFGCTRA